MPHAAGCSITLVASNRPPRPTSIDARVGRVAGEGEERGGGGDLEEARAERFADVEHFLEQRRQLLVRDQLAGDADALVVAHEVRLDRAVHVSPSASMIARR
jgi:hypothetical protein